jgi:XTP/dITP diphosphohydrolase/tetrapyrrole methylase family protein/MazG family protein/ATP diphosphatase
VADKAKLASALVRLDELAKQLRRECPWDREQNEQSIVPHTVEEAYELSDAVHSGDERKLVDELGDVLYQVYFLALLLEERGASDLADVADHCRDKLVRRHPHVFGDAEASSATEVRHKWEQIKTEELAESQGPFGNLPESLPAAIYAAKTQRRAASVGSPYEGGSTELSQAAKRLADSQTHEESFSSAGDLLFLCVSLARQAGVDAELALRAASDRFKAQVQAR